MRSFSQLGGLQLRWKFDSTQFIPRNGEHEYFLMLDSEPIASAQAIWNGASADFQFQCDDGTYSVHIDTSGQAATATVTQEGAEVEPLRYAPWPPTRPGGNQDALSGTLLSDAGSQWGIGILFGASTTIGGVARLDDTKVLDFQENWDPQQGVHQVMGQINVSAAGALDPRCSAICAVALGLVDHGDARRLSNG